MGARIKEGDVLDLLGLSAPTDEDRVLENPQIKQAEMMAQMSAGMGGPGGESAASGNRAAVPADIDTSPQGIAQDMMESLNSDVPDDQPSMYVAEGDHWVRREIPDADKDTGDRHKLRRGGQPDRYAYEFDESEH